MTYPIGSQNKTLNYSITIPNEILARVQITQTNSTLRTTQASHDSFSLKSILDSISNGFKSIFSWFSSLFSSSSTNTHTSNSTKDQIARIAARDQFIWFYKKEENALTAFLGNFHPCSIQLWGMQFQCAEAAFQAAKFSPDRAIMARFQTLDGEAAFKLGRQLSQNWTPQQTNNWRNRNLAVMREVVKAKFTQNADLKELLLATGNAYLVEHVPVKHRDAFWGDDSDGTGYNWLGQTSMAVRGSLGGTAIVPRNQKYNQFLARPW